MVLKDQLDEVDEAIWGAYLDPQQNLHRSRSVAEDWEMISTTPTVAL
jgi:hypothetical protein